ncbi:hypothetical protein BCR37DRAFT_265260 [Protomyces lactucae-debilis]|uniref:Uncharacterized protein n=1 Tax=Protomyces lactucae-debilis TaxID=2754530 RepID=A0A1Y2FLC1_PROLT|nr:uncharacterized protein BCR37DRAFT_265260 [Protomyces lactucae-debilis]ORY84377.1 hypothetical protein BCR37DRAFT_265260 [Protomyces lactucae-debilis]
MNAAVSGRTSTEVSITGSTPSQMNRFLTYTVMDGSNQPITGTAASDGSGQFAFSFTSTSAGSVRIDGFDIAGNPMQTSVVYSAFVAPSTTSSSSAPPLTSAPLSLVNSSTSTQMTNQTTAQTLSRPSTVLNITATAVPFMSSASQPGIGSIAPIPASPTTVTSTVTTTVHGPTQTVVALRLFVNGLPILDAEDKSLTAGSGRVTVIVSIGKVLIAVSVDSVGPAIAAIISGGPSLDGLAPTIVSLIVVMIPAISVSSSSNVTTTTTVQGFMTVVTGIAGVAPGVDTIPATTVVTTQTVLVTSLGSSVPTVLPVVGIAGGIGAVAPDSQDSGTYVAAGPVLTSVVSRPSPSSATPTTSEPAKTTIAVPASLGGAERCSSAMFAGILALASLLLIYK